MHRPWSPETSRAWLTRGYGKQGPVVAANRRRPSVLSKIRVATRNEGTLKTRSAGDSTEKKLNNCVVQEHRGKSGVAANQVHTVNV